MWEMSSLCNIQLWFFPERSYQCSVYHYTYPNLQQCSRWFIIDIFKKSHSKKLKSGTYFVIRFKRINLRRNGYF